MFLLTARHSPGYHQSPAATALKSEEYPGKERPMMDNSMMGGVVMVMFMVASTLFALVIPIAAIIQTVVQVKLLDEVRKLRQSSGSESSNDPKRERG
jgi:hypothetical protein